MGWAYFRVINDPLQQLVAKKGGGRIFEGGHIFERLRYIVKHSHMDIIHSYVHRSIRPRKEGGVP